MSDLKAWGFTDDRGTALGAVRVPERLVAYVRAGAALLDLGVTPVAVYGSGHDGEGLDPVKAGELGAAGVPYLGPGRVLDEARLGSLRPDLIVDVTYDGKSAYALDGGVAERIGVPLAALSVGNELPLTAIIARFGELAAALGGAGDAVGEAAEEATGGAVGGVPGGAAGGPVAPAEAALRAAAARVDVGVLALSGAGPDQVHLARPHAWPELARLQELGVRMLEPGPGAGANWLTADWEHAARLNPGLVLYDSRANAVGPGAFPPVGHARVAPWNPETPPSPAAYARFFQDIAEALLL
ncbi:ABC transporter substrate-binding protein [Streptomyces sp. Je 1-79]|uniref:ABC transporter substrate-binding protein n=1 Tax=Streptomyces sp. Je 1-79 TaxID=2943847 RepID=UPI0021A66FAA|nr:ABC transporter substrate-binding protein [Streptomyces sp. Je 1-79]MCT4356390.1 ABC transporter substrate-binding protein [Streptomyces sp. Je 1-79]